MMEERADRIIEITAEVLKYTQIAMFGYWEDMAYNHGPLVSPKMYRKLAFKHYRRVNDLPHSQGIEHVWHDNGGYIPELDHSVPQDVSWLNFCEYVEYLKLCLGRC